MSKQAADQARARARRCVCAHRSDAHGPRSDGGPIISWCRECEAECRFTPAEPATPSAPTCPYPDKQAHPNRGSAEQAARKMRGNRTGSGLAVEAFECRAGHWHIGRPSKPKRRP